MEERVWEFYEVSEGWLGQCLDWFQNRPAKHRVQPAFSHPFEYSHVIKRFVVVSKLREILAQYINHLILGHFPLPNSDLCRDQGVHVFVEHGQREQVNARGQLLSRVGGKVLNVWADKVIENVWVLCYQLFKGKGVI